MALSWTQDRMGPLCRYSEDCAIVMSVIAKPDGKDLSVTEIPFNWNARYDIKKLRVGYLKEAFADTRDATMKKHDEEAMAQIEKMGFKLVEVKVPEGQADQGGFNVESGAFFDELVRSGRDKEMTSPQRGSGFRTSRVIPAVEYIQGQRVRSMMMAKLAEATAEVDVYLVPANAGGGGGGRGRGGAAGGGRAGAPPADFLRRQQNATSRHFGMANTAGYPAINVTHGFTDEGTPTPITIYGRPYMELEILALAKAYQDATGFHKKTPNLEAPGIEPKTNL
jgi:Asp-tRNA(Asn)/Glu-tRNA(Gln) amidotransferase A subunit family amidase